jgi:hypothetical protein
LVEVQVSGSHQFAEDPPRLEPDRIWVIKQKLAPLQRIEMERFAATLLEASLN